MANLPTRQNNPGDLRNTHTGAYETYANPQEGFDALKNDLQIKMSGHSKTGVRPDSSLLHFSSIYAPASDKNDPVQYAHNLANKLGVDVNTPINSLSNRLDDFANAIADNEGFKGQRVSASSVSASPAQSIPNNNQPQQMDMGNFAAKIKAKYPQYQNIPDAELTQKILAKYPQYSSVVGATVPTPQQSTVAPTHMNTMEPNAGQPEGHPTFVGGLIRGITKPIVRAANNIGAIPSLLAGNEAPQNYSNYYGDVTGYGLRQGETGAQKAKDVLGGILDVGTFGLPVGKLFKGAEEAAKLTETAGQTVKRGFKQGALVGGLAGTGSTLSNNNDATLGQVVGGGLLGAATGGILGGGIGLAARGVGSLAERGGNVSQERINYVKSSLKKDLEEGLGKTTAGTKILGKFNQGMSDSLDAGFVPQDRGGLYDATEALKKLGDLQDQGGAARGAAIESHNQPVTIDQLKKSALKEVGSFYQDSIKRGAIEKKVAEIFDNWKEFHGNNIDLKKANSFEISAGKEGRGAFNAMLPEETAIAKQAAKQAYFGIQKEINNLTKGSGTFQETNKILSKYHRIQDFLEAIDGKKIGNPGYGKAIAEMGGTAIGGAIAGFPGTAVGYQAIKVLEKVLGKYLGFGSVAERRVMEALQSGEEAKLQEILTKIAQQKGDKVVQDLIRELETVPQLNAPAEGAARTQIGSGGIINLPERSQSAIDAAERANPNIKTSAEGIPQKVKKSGMKKAPSLYESYTPPEELPVIQTGKVVKRKGLFPIIR